MSGSFLGGVIGAVIGFFVSGGNPMGALYGWSAGSAIGGMLSSGPTIEGPRLSDLKPQSSEYGRPIPIVYGTVGIAGNVIWASDYIEVKTESGGGKGSPTVENYSYFGNFAVAFCEGEATVIRLWAGPEKRLIWDGTILEGTGSVRFYSGSETQLPDPLIESYLGAGNVPAYRGTCYVVFERFPLAKDGNALPFITAEVTTGGNQGLCGAGYRTVPLGPTTARLYDRPPVKLGNMGAMQTALNGRATVSDKNGNIFFLLYDTNRDWYLKKVSSTNPISESLLPLGPSFNNILQCKMDYDPDGNMVGIIQDATRNFMVVNCDSLGASANIQLDHNKTDILYSQNAGKFLFLNSMPAYDESGKLDPDSWGIPYLYATGKLIECGPHGIVVALDSASNPRTFMNGDLLANISATLYDPVRDRLLALNGIYSGYTAYYDFAKGETVIPSDTSGGPRLNATYVPQIDRIFYTGGGNLYVMNPAKLTSASFPSECVLINSLLVYGDGVTPVQQAGFNYFAIPIAGKRNKIAVAMNYPNTDIFTFSLGMNGGPAVLANVVADLSERAGQPNYDVSALTDIVDGYTIARQTTVRNAIDALRPAYYFDAVESGGKIKYVKRGGAPVATIDTDDLDTRSDGQAPGDPLLTTRQMEVELPRVVNVNYLLAATDYSPATKLAKRLVGASGSESTLDLPLVLTDTKAQEIADVNLQVAWVQRLTYAFNLPRKYSELEPTDHIVVKGNGMRLTKATRTPQGVIKCEAVADGSTFYTPNTTVTETPPNEQTVYVPGATALELM